MMQPRSMVTLGDGDIGAEPDVFDERDRPHDAGDEGHGLVADDRIVADGGEDAVGGDVAVRADGESAPAVEDAAGGEMGVVADVDEAVFAAGGEVGAWEKVDVVGDGDATAALDEAIGVEADIGADVQRGGVLEVKAAIEADIVADFEKLGMLDVDVVVDDDIAATGLETVAVIHCYWQRMPELRSYSKTEMPRDLAVQVASYVRVQWPFVMGQRTPLWEATPYPLEGRHFVISDGDVLISHALAHFKRVEHAGQEWKVGALSSVFTYPTHRGEGQGEKVAAAATEYLRNGSADFAMLFCGQRVKSLYLRIGWEHRPGVVVSSGDRACAERYLDVHPEHVILSMMMSERARDARELLEGSPIYVGANTW